MARNSFVQKANLFSYTGTECLRNAYYHNDCSNCMDICPEGAFHIVRNKLTLFDNECIECAACIGSCPSEALSIDSFDPNTFTLLFKESEEVTISCKKNTPCLGVFDAHHFISMALRSEKNPVLDLSHCAECKLNVEEKVEAGIRSKMAISNAFFEETGYEAEVTCIEERPEEQNNERRAFFRKALDGAKEAITEEDEGPSITYQHQIRADTSMPLKNIILKNSIKEKIPGFKITAFEMPSPLFFNKSISFDACTNCGDCVQFCPTEALFASADKLAIGFNGGKCIGCSICDDICKPKAITSTPEYDLVEIVYERSKELVRYEMVMCHECRCPYPYKGGDPICDRCKEFADAHANMFTLAKDL